MITVELDGFLVLLPGEDQVVAAFRLAVSQPSAAQRGKLHGP